MRPEETHTPQTVQEELETLSPRLASLRQREVPMPHPHYFDTLANEAIAQASANGGATRSAKLIPMGVAALAAAACLILALALWPTPATNTGTTIATMDSLSDEELIQLALQEDALLESQLMENDTLVQLLAANTDFQFLAPTTTNANQEYNKLLLEMIDDETLLEDIL